MSVGIDRERQLNIDDIIGSSELLSINRSGELMGLWVYNVAASMELTVFVFLSDKQLSNEHDKSLILNHYLGLGSYLQGILRNLIGPCPIPRLLGLLGTL